MVAEVTIEVSGMLRLEDLQSPKEGLLYPSATLYAARSLRSANVYFEIVELYSNACSKLAQQNLNAIFAINVIVNNDEKK